MSEIRPDTGQAAAQVIEQINRQARAETGWRARRRVQALCGGEALRPSGSRASWSCMRSTYSRGKRAAREHSASQNDRPDPG